MRLTSCKTIILTAFLLLSTVLFAGKVQPNAAQTVALNFYNELVKNNTHLVAAATLKYTQTETDGTVDFYVFDISPKGFVIVSATDQVSPVIGYSLERNFNPNVKGHAVSDWMKNAGSHIYKAIQRQSIANATISTQWTAWLQGQKPAEAKSLRTVAPLLTTAWGQDGYANALCPYNVIDQQRALTGCVATAMAQIMKYWNYPQRGTGSYGYMDAPPSFIYNYGNQTANFGATTYNWANMPDMLTSDNISVATLMYHCGVAVAMNYGDINQGGSGAYVLNIETNSWRPTAQKAYCNYFGYNGATITGVREVNYTAEAWIALMKSELNAGRPIQYEGSDPSEGGHTWVCDGYDENDFLHMNWGWNGEDNGYYSIASLSADGYNFSSAEAALIGIQPISGLAVTTSATATQICAGGSTTLTAASHNGVNYNWAPATGLSCATCAVTQATPDTTTTYTITIDSAGFSASSQVKITVNKLAVTSLQTANTTCYGSANGAAKVTVSGGTAAYTYNWQNGATRAAATGLTAGNYGITVTDAMGCSVTANATISQPEPLVANITLNNAACNLTEAFLRADVQGGTPAYFFSWSDSAQGNVLSSVSAGVYSVSVTDSLGCTASSSFEVVAAAPLVVDITTANTTCSLLYATATANVTGGSKNFSFLWNTGDITPSIVHLSAGTYAVTVSDSLGCSSSASVSIIQPDTMNIHISTSALDYNKVYGQAVAKVTGGAPQFSYLWSTGDTTEAISYNTPGNYTVTITDSRGCSQSSQTEVATATGIDEATGGVLFNLYPNPAANMVTISTPAVLADGTIEIKDILGQTVFTSKASQTITQIDLSGFAGGNYLVVVSSNGQNFVKELIIKK